MVKRTVAELGRLDYAYNNAGVKNLLAEAAYQTIEDFEALAPDYFILQWLKK